MKIGVLTPVQHSWCSTHVFIAPKKEGNARFITDYNRLNQKLVINPYQLPRIVETIKQLEGFQKATTLYLNIVYYTIRLSPASQDVPKIVTEFGKFIYNCLPMGMCATSQSVQANL